MRFRYFGTVSKKDTMVSTAQTEHAIRMSTKIPTKISAIFLTSHVSTAVGAKVMTANAIVTVGIFALPVKVVISFDDIKLIGDFRRFPHALLPGILLALLIASLVG
jgi:hypothetical protein